MILFSKITKLLGKIGFLLLLLSFEKVVGYPILFLTFTMAFLLTANPVSKYILYLFSGIFLAVLFNMSFVASLLIVSLFYFGFKYGSKITESNLHRFLGLLLLSVLLISYSAQVQISVWIFVQLFFSTVFTVVFLVKVLFVKYGFLGANLTAKQSFLH